MTKRHSARDYIAYQFDNLMSQGTAAKVKLLLIVTAAYVVVIGLVSAFLTPNNVKGGAPDVLWGTMLYVLGKGVPSLSDGSPVYVALSLLNVLYCLFFTAILIGLINQGIRSKMDQLSKGSGRVLEEGHVLILGFNDAAFVLIGELIEANRNQKAQKSIVILGDADWREMTDAIRKQFGGAHSHPQTKIVCRTGAICDFNSLRRCSLETSRVVIVNGNSDFDAVRAIIACAHLLSLSERENLPYLVSVIHGADNIAESSAAIANVGMSGVLEYLPLNETLAQIMVHTSRQPGLSDVFTELFNYADDEFYVIGDDPCFSRLWGRSIAEINLMLKTAYAVGVVRASGEVTIAAPNGVRFNEGDSLILIQEDDNPLEIAADPVSVNGMRASSQAAPCAATVLVLGARPILGAVLKEYASYLQEGSTVHIADSERALAGAVDDAARELFARAGISIVTHGMDIFNVTELTGLLDECRPDSALVLVNHVCDDVDSDDERTVRLLVYLREYRSRTGAEFSITSEIHRALNKELVSVTGPDDFIIGDHMSALLMAQISENRRMAAVFRVLLVSDGFEVYLKRASWYVQVGEPVDLLSVGQAVADCGEILIGVRQKREGSYGVADINPSKYTSDMQTLRKYTFSEDDFLVVLAESGDFPLME